MSKKQDDIAADIPDSTVEVPGGSAKKGRPTPKRKESEAKHNRALLSGDTKADRAAQRAKQREQREREYLAMRTGDEANMPFEHKGPERRYIRDFIDARWSLGEWLIPIMFVFLIPSLFITDTRISIGVTAAFYAVIALAVVEVIWVRSRLKKAFDAKFGLGRLPRGWTFYFITRYMNIRRFRVPKPKVNRGDTVK